MFFVDNDVTMSAINLSSKKEDKSPDLINGKSDLIIHRH